MSRGNGCHFKMLEHGPDEHVVQFTCISQVLNFNQINSDLVNFIIFSDRKTITCYETICLSLECAHYETVCPSSMYKIRMEG